MGGSRQREDSKAVIGLRGNSTKPPVDDHHHHHPATLALAADDRKDLRHLRTAIPETIPPLEGEAYPSISLLRNNTVHFSLLTEFLVQRNQPQNIRRFIKTMNTNV